MKKTLVVMLAMTSLSVLSATKTVSGPSAQDLLQALFQSGVEIVDTQTGFKLLEPTSVACRGSREQQYTGGVLTLAPSCFKKKDPQATNFFNFDQELSNTVSLVAALDKVGADADAAMGTYYTSADEIMCEFTESPRQTKCTFKVNY